MHVVETRDQGDAIRRRRECAGCGNRFNTYERAEELPIDVVKRDGGRERFDRRKLLRGLVRAAGGRPVAGEQLEELADSIAAEVRRAGPEVEASLIGDLAERGLARLDPVTAIQFASVYRRLADLDELSEVVQRLRDEPLPGADQLPLEEASNASPVPSDPKSSIGRSPVRAPRATEEQRRTHVREH
jgi:transcriptional repressor NrdR